MRNTLAILIFFTSTCFGQVNVYPYSPVSTNNYVLIGKGVIPTPIGTLFDAHMNSSLFTRTGSSGTWTYNNSDSLAISGTGSGNPDNYTEYSNWYTSLEKATSSITFTPNSDGYGIGVGIVGYYPGGTVSYIAKVALTGSTKGQLIYQKVLGSPTSSTTLLTSGTTYFPITNGNQYVLSMTRTPDTVTVTITGDGGQTQSIKYPQSYTEAGFMGQKCGRISIIWYGGNQTVYDVNYSTPIAKYPRLLCLGASVMQGGMCGADSSRFTQKLIAYYQDRIEVDAGASNSIVDLINMIPEITLIAPRYVYIDIGGNAPFTQAYLDTLRNNLLRNSISIFLGTEFPITSGLFAGNYIIRGETGVTLIDFDATMQNGHAYLDPSYAASDGGHMSAAGDNAIYGKLVSALTGYLTPK